MAFKFPRIKQKNTLNFIERIRLKLEELFRKRKKIKSRSIYYLQRRARNEELTSTIKLRTGRFGFFSRWKKLKSFYKKRLVIRRFLLKTINGLSNKKFRNIFQSTKKGKNTVLNNWYLRLACRLDVSLVKLRLIPTIGLAQYFIKTNRIFVNNKIINFPDYIVNNKDIILIKPFTCNWKNLYSKLFEKKLKLKLAKIIKSDTLILAKRNLTQYSKIKSLKLKLKRKKSRTRKNRYYLKNYKQKIKSLNVKIKQSTYWTKIKPFYSNSYLNVALKSKVIKNILNSKRNIDKKIPNLGIFINSKKINRLRRILNFEKIKNYSRKFNFKIDKILFKKNKKGIRVVRKSKKKSNKRSMNNYSKFNIKYNLNIKNINQLNKTVRYYSNRSIIQIKHRRINYRNQNLQGANSKFYYKKKLKFKALFNKKKTIKRSRILKNSLINKYWYIENLETLISKRISKLKVKYLNLNIRIRKINQSSKLRWKLRLRKYLKKLYKAEQRYKKLVLKPKKVEFLIRIKKENKLNSKINYIFKDSKLIKTTSNLILPHKVIKNLTGLRLYIIKSNILNRKSTYNLLQKKFTAKKSKFINKIKLFGKLRLKWKFLTKRHIYKKIKKLRYHYRKSKAKTLILKKKIEHKNHFLFKKKWKNLNFGRLFRDKFYKKKLIGFTNDWTKKIKFIFNSNLLKKV